MNYYKEIFLNFEDNCKISPQIFNLFSADTNNKFSKDENKIKKFARKGFNFSFDFYIIQW